MKSKQVAHTADERWNMRNRLNSTVDGGWNMRNNEKQTGCTDSTADGGWDMSNRLNSTVDGGWHMRNNYLKNKQVAQYGVRTLEYEKQ